MNEKRKEAKKIGPYFRKIENAAPDKEIIGRFLYIIGEYSYLLSIIAEQII